MNGHAPRDADIMIVDDTIANLRLLTGMIRDRGYKVRPFPSGELALEAVERLPPDLILLDINMPGMDGFELCRRLKACESCRDIPVIFLSARDATEDKVAAFEVGGVDYVTKPFRFEEVHSRIQAHLELRWLRRTVEIKNEHLEEAMVQRAEHELLKEKLVQMIVHDLKSPLSAIMSNTVFLGEDLPGDCEEAEALEDVMVSAETMHRMVLNILDVLRPDATKLPLRRSCIDAVQLVRDAIRTLRPAAAMTAHTLELHAEERPVEAQLDPDLLQRVVENLIENAQKYSPQGTPIRLQVYETAEDEIAIDVHDRGRGIPEEQRERIFDLYSRLGRDQDHHARRSRGLGLAFCRLAVEAHGGHISVHDAEPTGALFRVRLPRSKPNEAATGDGITGS